MTIVANKDLRVNSPEDVSRFKKKVLPTQYYKWPWLDIVMKLINLWTNWNSGRTLYFSFFGNYNLRKDISNCL